MDEIGEEASETTIVVVVRSVSANSIESDQAVFVEAGCIILFDFVQE